MKKNRFEKWLQNIYHTQEVEISCSECFDLISAYVELELSGRDPQTKMPQVNQHLQQCPACHEEYVTLRDLRQMEKHGEAPSIDDLRDSIQ